MENKTLIFKRHYEVELRTQIDEKGQVWFVAKDVCDMLGLTNPTETMKALDEDEVKLMPKQYLGIENEKGQQDINVINESGLYHLIFLSRKPEAKAFRRWVTGEVLPSIRRTGGYVLDKADKYLEWNKFRDWARGYLVHGDIIIMSKELNISIGIVGGFFRPNKGIKRKSTHRLTPEVKAKIEEWIIKNRI